jgi:iron complex transport system substrate-binding protein
MSSFRQIHLYQHLALLCCLLCAFLSCRQPTAPQTPRRLFTDELNRPVAIAEHPQRIISLAPNLTELLFALGLDERLVGVTSFCDFPLAARSKTAVGNTLQPDLEKIIALKPDLVVVTTASQLEKLFQQLAQLAIPVYVTNPRTVRDVLTSLRHLGEITGTSERAAALANEWESRINAVEKRNQALSPPRVLFVLQLAPLITVGRNTFLNDLITLAGGASISASETADYPQFSRESVLARAPEIIVIPGNNLVDEAEARAAFAVTPAVRNRRLAPINPDLTSRPGPRLIDGLEELARAFHPAKP